MTGAGGCGQIGSRKRTDDLYQIAALFFELGNDALILAWEHFAKSISWSGATSLSRPRPWRCPWAEQRACYRSAACVWPLTL
jgi:hypothetical protein